MRQELFPVRVGRNRLPEEVVKGLAGWGFEQLGLQTKMLLPMAGSWNGMICKVPSNPNHFLVL